MTPQKKKEENSKANGNGNGNGNFDRYIFFEKKKLYGTVYSGTVWLFPSLCFILLH